MLADSSAQKLSTAEDAGDAEDRFLWKFLGDLCVLRGGELTVKSGVIPGWQSVVDCAV